MKKAGMIAIGIALLCLFVACSPALPDHLDLSQAEPDLAFAYLADMGQNPERYEGKEITLRGTVQVFVNEEGGEVLTCLVSDGTGYQMQGLEIALAPGQATPEHDTVIVVNGTFERYQWGERTLPRLTNCRIPS